MKRRSRILAALTLLVLAFAAIAWWLRRPPPPGKVRSPSIGHAPSPVPTPAPAVASVPPAEPLARQAAEFPSSASVSSTAIPAGPRPTNPGVAAVAPPLPLPEQTVVAAAPPQPVPVDETLATARMYAAHASLRTPEVADPDSAANKQALATMLGKSLAEPARPPPSAAPGKQ